MNGNRALILAALVALSACTGGRPEPVEIVLDEDNCSSCRMAISQREFAAEVVTVSGSVDTFDDIGCLRDWVGQNRPPQTAGIFVVDYGTGKWIDARSASYVVSDDLPTPMSSGLAAFEQRASALAAAADLDGQVRRWEEVLKQGRHE